MYWHATDELPLEASQHLLLENINSDDIILLTESIKKIRNYESEFSQMFGPIMQSFTSPGLELGI